MKRKYQYRGRQNRINRVYVSRNRRINKFICMLGAKKALRMLHEFDVAMQKARQAAMRLPEYASGGQVTTAREVVGCDGMPELIRTHTPVKE